MNIPDGVVVADDGLRWARIRDAATTCRVREDLIRQWHHRHLVRGYLVHRRLWVCLDDVEDCELDLRLNGARPGRRRGGVDGV